MFSIYMPTKALRSESQSLLLPPKHKTNFGSKDIAARGCVYWNTIELPIHSIDNLDVFKTTLKTYDPP